MGAGTRSRKRSLSCGAKCSKLTLVIFNIFFLLLGAAILGVSIFILADPDLNDYLEVVEKDDNNDFIMAALIVFILSGTIIVGTAIMGIIGACCNSRCLLALYSVLMICIILAEVGAGVMAVMFRVNLSNEVRKTMREQVHLEVGADPNDDTITSVWYRIQYYFECCGGKSHVDYIGSKFYNDTQSAVPETCCKLTNKDPLNPTPVDYTTCKADALADNTASGQLWPTGCYDALTDWLKDNAAYIIGAGVGIIILEILGIVLACMLIGEVRRLKR